MAVVTQMIGGRSVVAAGELVLAGGDLVASVVIDDLIYTWLLLHSAGPPVSRTEATGKVATLNITGDVGATGAVWWYNDVGTWNGQKLSLAFAVNTYSGNPGTNTAYILKYTFTASSRTPNALTGT